MRNPLARPRFAFAGVLLLATLAGCTSGDPGDAATRAIPTDIGFDFGRGTAVLQGQVTDTEKVPLDEAELQIADLDPILSDSSGLFRATGLPAGTHLVTASAIGHATVAREVTLRDGEIQEAVFELERLASVDPYLEILNFRGYSYCDYMLIWSHGRLTEVCGDDIGDNNTIFRVNVSGTWQYIVSEIDWTPVYGGTSDAMRLVHGTSEFCSSGDPCYGVVYGTYYARLEGEPGGKTDVVTHYDPYTDNRGPPYPNDTFDLTVVAQWAGFLREELRTPPPADYCQIVVGVLLGGGEYKPGCLGVGVSTGISFDLWTTLFHNAKPADYGACCPATEYTALPDN